MILVQLSQLCSGAKLDVQDKDGFTPLMLAAIKGCERTFDVMVKSKDGMTVFKETLFRKLVEDSLQLGGHQTNVSEQLNVSK